VTDPARFAHDVQRRYAYGTADTLISESPVYANLGKTPEERMLVYRFNVIHNRDYELENNKPLKKRVKLNKEPQPVPF